MGYAASIFRIKVSVHWQSNRPKREWGNIIQYEPTGMVNNEL
jgi:hypothetical protein